MMTTQQRERLTNALRSLVESIRHQDDDQHDEAIRQVVNVLETIVNDPS